MIIYTIGFTQKNAEKFFESIKNNNIEVLIDVRLNNKSQLAGFAKGEDLAYFLPRLSNCKYEYRDSYAPTKEMLDAYKKGEIDWNGYVSKFTPLIASRRVEATFLKDFGQYERVCLLCSEATPEQCHRRLLAEYFKEYLPLDIEIKHI